MLVAKVLSLLATAVVVAASTADPRDVVAAIVAARSASPEEKAKRAEIDTRDCPGGAPCGFCSEGQFFVCLQLHSLLFQY